MQQLLIPEARAKTLTTKHSLSAVCKKLKCDIEISNGNEVSISGDAYDEFNARNVITAFGRGFDLEIAYKLLSEEYMFESINLKEEFKSENHRQRIKARVIGEGGKAKTYIEETSEAYLSIYGNTVSFIGTLEQIKMAKAAVEVLLEGGTHKSAYKVMEAIRRNMKKEKFGLN